MTVHGAEPKLSSTVPIVVVSGLPRSGTSLLMQMLEAGGLPILSDGIRPADSNNPNGYFELEAIKSLPRAPLSLGASAMLGKCVKVVSPLLSSLPQQYQYKVLYTHRNMAEVMSSQQKMLGDSGQMAATETAKLAKKFSELEEKTQKWLNNAVHMQVLRVSHAVMISNPDKEIARITRFLGRSMLPNQEDMSAVVDTRLYRNRATKTSWLQMFKR